MQYSYKLYRLFTFVTLFMVFLIDCSFNDLPYQIADANVISTL